MSHYKLKILAGVLSTGAVGTAIMVPYASKSNSSRTSSSEDELPVSDESLPIKPEPRVGEKREEVKETINPVELGNKFMTLKNTRHAFDSHVEKRITFLKNILKDVGNYNELESKFNNCRRKNSSPDWISEDEKTNLKNLLEILKKEVSKHEEILKKSKQFVPDLDKQEGNQSEDGYKNLKEKFDNLTSEYNSIIDELSDDKFLKAFSDSHKKLVNTNDECSFRDVMRLNDDLGRQNNEGKWTDRTE